MRYKRISREPTEEMLKAALVQYDRNAPTAGIHVRRIIQAAIDAAPDIESEAEKYMRLRLFEADNFDLDVVPVSREQIRALLRERGIK